jgi:hypothetical protein
VSPPTSRNVVSRRSALAAEVAYRPDEAPDEMQSMEIKWAAWYHPEWDEQPQRYVDAGVVAWERSKRLAKASDARLELKAYIGVRHSDPSRWNLPGEPSARFFLSLFIRGRTVSLRTYPTIAAALSALQGFHEIIQAQRDRRENLH